MCARRADFACRGPSRETTRWMTDMASASLLRPRTRGPTALRAVYGGRRDRVNRGAGPAAEGWPGRVDVEAPTRSRPAGRGGTPRPTATSAEHGAFLGAARWMWGPEGLRRGTIAGLLGAGGRVPGRSSSAAAPRPVLAWLRRQGARRGGRWTCPGACSSTAERIDDRDAARPCLRPGRRRAAAVPRRRASTSWPPRTARCRSSPTPTRCMREVAPGARAGGPGSSR